MKRRKQILAFSLAALMVLGGVLDTGTLSVARAETAGETLQAADVSGGNGGEVVEPTSDGEVAVEDAKTDVEADLPSAVSSGDVSSGNVEIESHTGEVDLSSNAGLAPNVNYGDDVVTITLMGAKNTEYKTASKTVTYPDEVKRSYTEGQKMRETAAVTVGEDGTVTAAGAIKIRSTKPATIRVAQEKGTIHFDAFADGQLVPNSTALTGTAGLLFEIEANKDYYYYAEGGKLQTYCVEYTYDKEVPVEPYTNEVDLSSSAGLAPDVNYGDDVVAVTLMGAKNTEYKTASKTVTYPDEVKRSYTEGQKMRENGSVTVGEDGTVTAAGAIKIRSTKPATIRVAQEKGTIHFDAFADGQLVPNSTALTGTAGLLFEIEANKDYYYYAEGGKLQTYCIEYTYMKKAGSEPEIPVVPAFPGAEGGGKYATGGRGGDVYIVTSLADDGSEGTLRYGIEKAPKTGRTIVFNVGGTIHLKSTLTFKGKKNITIAGQTAPGEGITVAGYDTNISDSENIVIRFVRFRVGTENLLNGGDSMDALWGRDNDTFMIDHCTFSWNTDETLSTYRGKNGTVQWCLISESLTVSGHSKGRHGYGGIFGGDNTVFQYNLLTNHTSRNPRIGGGSMGDPTSDGSTATLQLSNNVLYNHGYFACYGGGYTYTNYINNYVKPGRGTRDALDNTLLGFGEKGKVGGVYYAGNILEGNEAVTKDNSLGFSFDGEKEGASATVVADKPYEAEAFNQITLTTAEKAYDLVLNSAGATYPRRDAVDARVVEQVKTDTGSYINTQDEVGGYPMPDLVEREEGFDTDKDGIPDEWETKNGLNPNDGTDAVAIITEEKNPNRGYTWLEVYFNELVEDYAKPTYVAENPTITLDLEDNKLVAEGESVPVTATVSAGVTKVEFFNGAEKVGEATSAPFSYTYKIDKDGTYHISARAYDGNGNATQSNTSRLHVNSAAGTGEWSSADVGNPGVKGTASLVDGVLTVKGAGKIGSSEGSKASVRPELADLTTDDFHYVYQKLDGNFEIVTKFDSYIPVDNHTFQGLMFRSSLESNAAMAALGFTMVKVNDATIWSAFMVNRAEDGGKVQSISETIDSPSAAKSANIPLIADLPFKQGNDFLGTWLKMVRQDDTFIGYVSSDGNVWQKVGEVKVTLPDSVYVGFAVDANRAGNDLINYGTAKFSNIKINRGLASVTYEKKDVEVLGAEDLAIGEDLTVELKKIEGYILPEAVDITIGGKTAAAGVDYTYEFDRKRRTGKIVIPNVQGDIVISAAGVKQIVGPVNYEEVDEADLLTITENAGKLVLTQVATSGGMQTTDKGTGAVTPAENVSYLLFPEVDEFQTLSMKVKVTSTTMIDKGDRNGFFIGAFGTDERGLFTTLGFRANGVLKGFWYKPGGEAGVYTGDGNPGFIDCKYDTEYDVVFKADGNTIVTGADGKTFTKTFKVSENALVAGDDFRYGIAIVGATVEISEMKLVDSKGNVIYKQDSADYSRVIAAVEKVNSLRPNDYVDFSKVEAACDAINLGLDATHQAEVDAMADAIEAAIAALVRKEAAADYSAVNAAVAAANKLNPEDYEDFSAVKAAVDAVVNGLPESEQARVDAMAKAINDAIAALVKKKPVDEKPVETETVVATPGNLADAMKEWSETVLKVIGGSTTAAVESFMKNQLPGDYSKDNSVTQEFKLQVEVTVNGVTTVRDATADDLKGGLAITLPYPDSVKGNYGDYDFTVKHLIIEGWNGQTPGTVEDCPVEKTEAGLKITVKSASPFIIAWKDADADDDDDDDEVIGTNVTTKGTKTGDHMDMTIWIWSIILLAALAGVGILVFRRRQSNK